MLLLAVVFVCFGATIAGHLLDPHRHGDSIVVSEAVDPAYKYKVDWTEQIFPVDHFAYTRTDKFRLKYLHNEDSYQPGGPIFFYAGNEGAIEGFAANTGIMFDLAPQFNASIVFAEHRYYGESMPFPNNASWAKISELGYLTSEQALADYAMFLPYYKEKYSFPNDTKVIVFGGSYGGMLATWFRLKYPTLTVGAWASSAPAIYFNGGGIDVGAFDAVVKRTYLSSGCDSETIDTAFQTITKLGQTVEGVEKLNTIFRIDENTVIGLPGDNYTATDLKLYIQQGFEYMAMTDYPYPTNFLEDMPGFPVKQACERLEPAVNTTDNDLLLYSLLDAVNVYYNYSGEVQTTCFDISKCYPSTIPLSGNPDGWDFQECTEVIIAMCALGPPNDFFDSICNATTFIDWQSNYCNKIYGTVGWNKDFIRLNAIRDMYGWDFTSASNIIFTNGILDPWSSAGVNENTPGISNANNRGIYNYRIASSAHHLDMRQPNTCDPPSVINLRFQVVEIFKCWLNPTSTACPFAQTELPEVLTSFNPQNCSYIFGQYPWGESIPTIPTTTPIQTTTHSVAAGTSIVPDTSTSIGMEAGTSVVTETANTPITYTIETTTHNAVAGTTIANLLAFCFAAFLAFVA